MKSIWIRETELYRQGAQWVNVIQEICCELAGSAESRKTTIERQRQTERPWFSTVAIGLLELYSMVVSSGKPALWKLLE